MNMSGAYQNPIYNQQMQQYGQQYAYNPYMNQPRIDNTQNYMQAPQQIQQQIPVQTFGINGKVVPAVENITANDVPMDGSVAIDGEPLQSTRMIVTPAAVENFFNVSAQAYVDVPRGCCVTVAVQNTSTQSIEVQNSNLIAVREA